MTIGLWYCKSVTKIYGLGVIQRDMSLILNPTKIHTLQMSPFSPFCSCYTFFIQKCSVSRNMFVYIYREVTKVFQGTSFLLDIYYMLCYIFSMNFLNVSEAIWWTIYYTESELSPFLSVTNIFGHAHLVTIKKETA